MFYTAAFYRTFLGFKAGLKSDDANIILRIKTMCETLKWIRITIIGVENNNNSITECVFVALGIQHVEPSRCGIVFCDPSGCTLFFTLSHKLRALRIKYVLTRTCVSIFSANLFETFRILSKLQRVNTISV